MKHFLVSTLLIFVSSFAFGSQWSGKVIELQSITGSRVVLFKLSEEIESPARCNEFKMYAIDLNAPGGSIQFDLLKLAYAEELVVEAESLNTCAAHWKSEGVKEIRIKPKN